MNLDFSLLRISSLIIKHVKKAKVIKLNELLQKLINSEGEDVRYIFQPALSFVYLFGLIEYHTKTDSIEFIQHRKLNYEN